MNLKGDGVVVFCPDGVGDALEDNEVGLLVCCEDDNKRADVDKKVEDGGVVIVEDGKNGITIAGFEPIGSAAEE